MDNVSLLFFGLLVGMQHALEADHLAAVASMGTKSTPRRVMILRGGAWGIGHTLTLVTICGALLLLEKTISPHTASLLELAVGTMIVYLGSRVLFRLFWQRIHFHFHRHGRGNVHLHVHSHASEDKPHPESSHNHEHHSPGIARALVIGMVHGAAGSAALLVLAAAAGTIAEAAGYVLAFGIGSILGMVTMSFLASYPLRIIERYSTSLNSATFACIGCAAILIGGNLIGESWQGL